MTDYMRGIFLDAATLVDFIQKSRDINEARPLLSFAHEELRKLVEAARNPPPEEEPEDGDE